MVNLETINREILDLEQRDTTFATCERLAWLYVVRDHLTGQQQKQAVPLETGGDSEFLQAVDGKDSVAVWAIMDDLMDTLHATAPRVYDRILRRVRDL